MSAAFTLLRDSQRPERLPANRGAARSTPWRPTTCQVTVATGEEGTGPVAIDTYPPTRLVSVVCDLHPWFLCEYSASPSLRSQSDRVYISAPLNFIYLFLIWSRRHAESLPQLTGSASSVTWSSSHVREEDTRAKASQMKLSFIDHGSKQWQDAAEKQKK